MVISISERPSDDILEIGSVRNHSDDPLTGIVITFGPGTFGSTCKVEDHSTVIRNKGISNWHLIVWAKHPCTFTNPENHPLLIKA